MTSSFAELINEAMDRKSWGDYQLSAAIGLLQGSKVFNPTQIRRLRKGQRQHLTREIVQRLIDVLDLDPHEAWFRSGLWPEGLTVEAYREVLGGHEDNKTALYDRRRSPRRYPAFVPQLVPSRWAA